MTKITVIPSTKNQHTQLPLGSISLRKVAAYARVSTNTDEQYTSYEAQVNYYRKFIQERGDWEYTNVYADEGISGTNTKRRTEFNRMITDALEGKIDLIITKSISRFARNTLDTISFVRKLKDKGVEVYFEKENLWTLDPKSELILTIMASIAQEESRSISQNVTWGKRVSFQEGKVSFAYKSFLGYKKENDKLVIDEDGAVIVKMIYRMFLVEGKTPSGIASHLTSLNIKTPMGKSTKWTQNTIDSILRNEKYKGDALLQKKYTINYLNHTLVKNTGQIPQYYVENNHPAIIDSDMWEQVQIELARRDELGAKYSSSDIFTSKLICEDCGGFYGKKKWHSNSKYARFIYQCNNKFHKHKEKCLTPNLNEESIKMKFIKAYNLVMEDKERIIQGSQAVIDLLTNTTKLDDEISKFDDELNLTADLVSILVKENLKTSDSLDDYNKKYEELSSSYEKLKSKREALMEQKNSRQAQALKMKFFVSNLKQLDDKLSDWNEHVWMLLVDSATVHRDRSITLKFQDGKEI
jgi:DNA invertase Pin-like site-specific DNA recombinase